MGSGRGALCAVGLALALAPAAGMAGEPLYREAAAPDVRGRAAAAGLPDLSRVAATTLPAVVGIVTAERDISRPEVGAGDPLDQVFQHFRGGAPKKGLATGFVVHPDGYIVTNAHVVENVLGIEVQLGDDDDDRIPAHLVGRDAASDVALIKVDVDHPLPVVPLGDSDRLQTAEWVMVIGNPFGLSHTVTVGIVSHLGRADVTPSGREGFYDFIQTDASINPGNSGGPLLNLRGEVVGIATAINATGQGIGFAVPINMAKRVLDQLRDHGKVVRSWMGVSVKESKAPRAGEPRQVVVTDVVTGSPAAASGLQVGDVITGFDGRAVASASRLRWDVSTAGVGRLVSLDVRRGVVQRALRVSLQEQPPPDALGGLASGPRHEPETAPTQPPR